MKQNVVQSVTGFVLKYIWLFCALLILLEVLSVGYTAGVLMQQSAEGIMQSVSGDVSGRVDGVLRLLTGMAADESFSNTSIPLFDRAILALPYQQSYGLYMIALTDEDVNVISADETEPPKENFSLAYRDYMKKLYATGKYQITDAFASGDGKGVMNYTIAVPIINNGKVEGSVFGSIRFDDIENIMGEQSTYKGRDFYLLGAENTIMAGENGTLNGKAFTELSSQSIIINNDVDTINDSILAGKSDSFWEWDKEGLTYVTYQRVALTEWTILHRVQFMPVFAKLLPVLIIKIFFFIAMCAAIYIFGRRYLNRHLSQINHLLNKIMSMQKELFQSEQADYDNLLELTQQGLTDQLTGLSTRAILLNKASQLFDVSSNGCAVLFIDLDDLKIINDNFGHEGGDLALITFAKTLKIYEQKHNGIAARYGGDEFILILKDIDNKTISATIDKLCKELCTEVVLKEHVFTVHGSIGASLFPQHGATLEELICKADLALYSAKQKGKNQAEIFGEEEALL